MGGQSGLKMGGQSGLVECLAAGQALVLPNLPEQRSEAKAERA